VNKIRSAVSVCAVLLILAASARADWEPLGTYRITAYCPCARCCGKSDGITADGTYAPTWPERIVSASKGIPFGTRMWIEGVGVVTVHDRGGAIDGRRAELFFQTHDEALQWGVQELKVSVWTKPSAAE